MDWFAKEITAEKAGDPILVPQALESERGESTVWIDSSLADHEVVPSAQTVTPRGQGLQ